MIATLSLSLCACGKDSDAEKAGDASIEVVKIENTVDAPETNEESASGVAQDNAVVKELEVIVRSDKVADFIFDSNSAQGMDNLTAVSVQFTDDYLIGLNDFDATGDFQCNVWKVDGNNRSIADDISADYSFDGSKVKLTADMGSVDGFSFMDISGDCMLHYEYKDQGGPQLTLAWSDVAKEELNPNAEAGSETTGAAGSSEVTELLDSVCGKYVEKGGDTLELVKTDNGYQLKSIMLKSRDASYNQGTDMSSVFGENGNVDAFDGLNVKVSFQTQLTADDGTAEINKDGFIILTLKGPNMRDYGGEFIRQ